MFTAFFTELHVMVSEVFTPKFWGEMESTK